MAVNASCIAGVWVFVWMFLLALKDVCKAEVRVLRKAAATAAGRLAFCLTSSSKPPRGMP